MSICFSGDPSKDIPGLTVSGRSGMLSKLRKASDGSGDAANNAAASTAACH